MADIRSLVAGVLARKDAARKAAKAPVGVERVRTLTRASTNPALSNNGGDYDYYTIAFYDIRTGKQLGVDYYTTSAEFDYCPFCGSFTNSCHHERGSLSPAEQLTLDIRAALWPDFGEATPGPVRRAKNGRLYRLMKDTYQEAPDARE